MCLQGWLLPLLMVVSIPGIITTHPPTKQPIVYTAENSREQPQPSYKSPTVGTTLDELYDETKAEGSNQQEPANSGFVEPIDFTSFLSQVGTGKKSDNLPIFGSESNNKDSFAAFFNNKDAERGGGFSEPSFSGLSSASSDQKTRNSNGERDDSGFVDPNVQFRSLFDSSETAHGFRPEDFLGSKGDSSGVDPSKGSQTRAFPSYTYTGRNGQNKDRNSEEDDHEQQPNRFRSSYRQVDSRGRNRDDGNTRDNGQQAFDPYDDSNYYGGEYDDSPASPPNPRNSPQQGYNNNNNNNRFSQRQGEVEEDSSEKPKYSPATQESSHAPQGSSPKAAASGGGGSGGKGKCKKVQKDVEYEEDYSKAYTDPEPDYDPSSYGEKDRYKRQSGRGGNGNNKKNSRPMTCYVCEDEQGRYAERCEYDSKGDPKNGGYFHSSSTSYNDNGRRPRGGRGSGSSERYRRNPSVAASKVPTTTASSVSTAESATVAQTTENSSDREKRQSANGRNNNNNNYDNEDYNDNNNDNDNDRDDGESNRNGNSRGNNNNNGDYDDSSDEEYSPQRSGTNDREVDSYERDAQTPSARTTDRNSNNDRNYGFGPPPQQGNNARGFDFGPPSDFGREPSPAGSNNRGFNFDFSIPRDFDPDVQLGGSNTNNRPVFSSSNNNEFGLGNFDNGYDDYVKKYFPSAFGSNGGGGGGGSGSTPGPSPASSSYRPNGPSSSSSSPPSHRGHSPNKEHTQQSHNYAPPPYYQEDDGGLEKLVGAFNQKARSGCQKVNKGDMTCYVCRDARGMNKEECMYASNDPNGKNTRMAYHESTEYSSPPVMIVPHPRSQQQKSAESTSSSSKPNAPAVQESIKNEKIKSPLDYDFDY